MEVPNSFQIWWNGVELWDVFILLFYSLPFTWVFYTEKKDNFYSYVAIRTDIQKYIKRKIITVLFLIFISNYLFNLISSFIVITMINPKVSLNSFSVETKIFGQMQLNHPYLFMSIYGLWKSFVITFMSISGIIIALYSRNLFLIAFGPFVIHAAIAYVFGNIRIPKLDITYTYSWNHLIRGPYDFLFMLFSLIIYGVIMVFLKRFMKRREKENELFSY